MALVATPGAADANAYPTLVEADAYNAERLDNEEWDAADDPTKEAGIIMATRLIDAMPQAWTGAAAVPGTQALSWPRTGMLSRTGAAIATNVIPQTLKDATSEFARQLIIDAARVDDNDVLNQRIASVKAGSVAVSFNKKELTEHGADYIRDNLTADPAGRLMVPDLVRVMLVPSWLLPTLGQEAALNQQTLVFKAI